MLKTIISMTMTLPINVRIIELLKKTSQILTKLCKGGKVGLRHDDNYEDMLHFNDNDSVN